MEALHPCFAPQERTGRKKLFREVRDVHAANSDAAVSAPGGQVSRDPSLLPQAPLEPGLTPPTFTSLPLGLQELKGPSQSHTFWITELPMGL